MARKPINLSGFDKAVNQQNQSQKPVEQKSSSPQVKQLDLSGFDDPLKKKEQPQQRTGQPTPQTGSNPSIPQSGASQSGLIQNQSAKAVQSLTGSGLGFGGQRASEVKTIGGNVASPQMKADPKSIGQKPKPVPFVHPNQFIDADKKMLQELTAQRDASLAAAKGNPKFIEQVNARYNDQINTLTQRISKAQSSIAKGDIGVSGVFSKPKNQEFSTYVGEISKGKTPEQATATSGAVETELEKFARENNISKEDAFSMAMGIPTITPIGQINTFDQKPQKAFEALNKDRLNSFANADLIEWSKTNPVTPEQFNYLAQKQKEAKKGKMPKMDEIETFITQSSDYNNELNEAASGSESLADFSFRKKRESYEEIINTLPPEMREFNKQLFELNMGARDILTSFMPKGLKFDKDGNPDLSLLPDADRKYLEAKMKEYNSSREKLIQSQAFAINDEIVKTKTAYNNLKTQVDKAIREMEAETDPNRREVYRKAIEGGQKQLSELQSQVRTLEKSKTSFLNPNPKQLGKQASTSSTAKAVFNAIPSNLSGKEKFDFFYRAMYKRNIELAQRYKIDQDKFDVAGQALRDWLDWESMGVSLTPQEKEFLKNKQLLTAMAPLYFNNASSVKKDTDGFFDSFLNGFESFISPSQSIKQTQTEIGRNQIEGMKQFGINQDDLTSEKAQEVLQKRVSEVPWYSLEAIGEAFGTTAAIVFDMASSGAMLSPVSTTRGIKTAASIFDKAMDASKTGRFLKAPLSNAVKYEATGQIIGSSEEEMNALSGFLGTIGGQAVGGIFEKMGSEKFKGYIASVFGNNADRAMNVLTKAGERITSGFGEIGEEVTQELVSIYNDELRERGFWEEVEARYGTFNDVMKLAFTSFIMGAGMGHNVSETTSKLESSLSDSEKQIIEDAKADVKTEFAEVAKETAKAAEEIAETESVDVEDVSTPEAVLTETTETAEDVPLAGEYTPNIVEDKTNQRKKEYTDKDGRFYSEKEILAMTKEKLESLDLEFRNPSQAVKEHLSRLFPTEKEVLNVEQSETGIENESPVNVPLTNEEKESKTVDTEAEGVFENPALKDVESTAKALEEGSDKENRLISALAFNKMNNDYNIGIRSINDIKTWDEVLGLDDESEGQFVWGDFTREDAEKALKENEITIYSSYPIKDGVFVSTSYAQAEEYTGGKGGKVYSKTIPLSEVSWINGDEGQYFSGDSKTVSEAYHKAKADGSNPELVQAVEKLLSEKSQPTQNQNEIQQQAQSDTKAETKEVGKEKAPVEKPSAGKSPSESDVKEAKKIVQRLTDKSGKINFIGDSNAEKRQRIIELLTGVKPTKSSATTRKTRQAIADFIGVDIDMLTDKGLEDAFKEWANKKDQVLTKAQKERNVREMMDSPDFANNPEVQTLLWFVTGGKITSAVRQSLYGKAKGRKVAESRVRTFVDDKNPNAKKSTDAIAEAVAVQMFEATGIDPNELNDGTNIKNEVETALNRFRSREEMIDYLSEMFEANLKKQKGADQTMGMIMAKLSELEGRMAEGKEIELTIPNDVIKASKKEFERQAEMDKDSIEAEKASKEFIKNTKWYNSLTMSEKMRADADIDRLFNPESILTEDERKAIKGEADRNPFKSIADSIRNLKTDKPKVTITNENGEEIDLFSMGLDWNDFVEAVASAVEKTGDIVGAVRDYLKDKDVYTSLSDENKKIVEEKLVKEFKKTSPTSTTPQPKPKPQQKKATPTQAKRLIPAELQEKITDVMTYEKLPHDKVDEIVQAAFDYFGVEEAAAIARAGGSPEFNMPYPIRSAILDNAGAVLYQQGIDMRNEAEKTNDPELLAIAELTIESAMEYIQEAINMGTQSGQANSYKQRLYEKFPGVFQAVQNEKMFADNQPTSKQKQGMNTMSQSIQNGVSNIVDESLKDEEIERLREEIAKLKAKREQSKQDPKSDKIKAARAKIEAAKAKFNSAKKQANISIALLSKEQIEAIGEMVLAYIELGGLSTAQIVNRVYREIADPIVTKDIIKQIARGDVVEFEQQYKSELLGKAKTKEERAKIKKEQQLESDPSKLVDPDIIRQAVKDFLSGKIPNTASIADVLVKEAGVDPADAELLAEVIKEKLDSKIKDLVAKEREKFIERNSKLPVSTAELRKKRMNKTATTEELTELARRESQTISRRENEQMMRILYSGEISSSSRLAEVFEKRFGYKAMSPAVKKQIDSIMLQLRDLVSSKTKEIQKGNETIVIDATQRARIKRLETQLNTLLDSQKPSTLARVLKNLVSWQYISMLSGPLTSVRAFVGGFGTAIFGLTVYTLTNTITRKLNPATGKYSWAFGGGTLLRAFIQAAKAASAANIRAVQSRKTGIDQFGENVMKGEASSDTKDWVERNILLGLGEAWNEKKYGQVAVKLVGQLAKNIHALGAMDAFLNTIVGNYIGRAEAEKKGETFVDMDADFKEIANSEFSEMIETIRQVLKDQNFPAEKIDAEVTRIIRKDLGITGSRLSAKNSYIKARVQELRENQMTTAFREAVAMAKFYSMISPPDGVWGMASDKLKGILNIKDNDSASIAIAKFIGNLLFRFVNMTANSFNFTLTSVPVFGMIPALVGPGRNPITGEFDTKFFGGKYRANSTLAKQRLAINVTTTSLTILAFMMSFEYDEEEKEWKLREDRLFDIQGFGESGMGGELKNKRRDPSWTNLRVSFTRDKDGNFTNYISVRLIPPLAAIVATLGVLTDVFTGRKSLSSDKDVNKALNEEFRKDILNFKNLYRALGDNIKIFTEQPFSSLGRMYKSYNMEDNAFDGVLNMMQGVIVDAVKPAINPSVAQSVVRAYQSAVNDPQREGKGFAQLAQNLYGLDSFLLKEKTDIFGNPVPEEDDYERFLKEFLGKFDKRTKEFKNIELQFKFGQGVNLRKFKMSEMKPDAPSGAVAKMYDFFGSPYSVKFIVKDKTVYDEVREIQEKLFNEMTTEYYDFLNSLETLEELETEWKKIQSESAREAKQIIYDKYSETNKIKKIEE